MRTRIRTMLSLGILAMVLGTTGYLWWRHGTVEPLPEGLIQANGRMEAGHYTVASKVAARVAEVRVQEGDTVAAGQVVVRLEAREIQARVLRARRSLEAARAEVRAAEAAERQASRDARRLRRLAAEGSVSERDAERAELDRQVARDRLAAARAQVGVAEAALAEAEVLLAELEIAAPAAGVVATRVVDPGDVVAAGAPLVDLVDLDRVYLKVYIPERWIGRLRLGLPGRVWVDAFPDTPFPATVRYISPRAEFTPREVQTPEERVKLVYAVKLYLDANPDHRLTPGLPADAVIRWREDAPWAAPRW